MKPIIQLESVYHEREHMIFKGLDWEVAKGENWILMGANGSGKSSIVNMISGYLYPTSGQVKVLEGHVEAEHGWPDKRLHIAVVSSYVESLIEEDQYAGDVVLTGREGSLNFWKDADPDDVEKTREVLTKIDAWSLCNREWGALSQGEKQKILIGRAIMNEAKLIVLDEPCAGLDPAAREHYLQFLQQLMNDQQDLTVVMVTHHVEEIVPSFDKILMIKDGNVAFCGDTEAGVTSEQLSKVFGADIEVEKRDGRYYSRVKPRLGKIF